MCPRSPTGPGPTERSSRLRVLTLNCGSSTLKFDVLDVRPGGVAVERIANGAVERIGSKGRAMLTYRGDTQEREVQTQGHRDAFSAAYELLEQSGCLGEIDAIGHRVVHGGMRFRATTRIEPDVIEAIREVSSLAPLHNGPALAIIEAAREAFGPDMAMVAAFDTAYFAELPDVASRYAIPKALSEQYGIRRFGFHGLAHAYMTHRFDQIRPEVARPHLITLQLGGGCSATASFDGMPLDTSMGYTPLEGLIMGTRSGDIDPALPLRLQALTGMAADEVEDLLNSQSGLLGLSGRSSEMRDILPVASQDEDARLAVEAFCASVKKYIGAYLAVLGGADAIVFGGGIGENMPEIRARICDGLRWAGVRLDPDANEHAPAGDVRISAEDSTIEVWVIRVDEAQVIARETIALLAGEEEGRNASER